MNRLIALFGLLVAGWPVLHWYGLRLHDGSDEPLGLAALAVAVFFAPRDGWQDRLSRVKIVALIVLLGGGALGYPWIPALMRGLLFVAMIGMAMAPKNWALAWTALLALSLPLVSTLQFYLSYPLRLPTTQLSALLLRACGFDVHANGTTLLWAGERVIVDAPCSGIHMAWAGLFFAATLACMRRFSSWETLRLFRWAGALVFGANVVRSTALFFLGAGIWRLPAFAHEGIGLVMFAVTLVFIYLCGMQARIPASGTHWGL
ncbi:MAG TPA: archaeosortase/exosortase family protein [Lacunisphaera sp.]|jgi:exosortase/archaeosortase family protein